MTSLFRKSAAATAGAALFAFTLSALVPPTDAQEAPTAKAKAKTSKKASAGKTDDEVEPKAKASRPDATHRVPMYFGGLGLSDEQKESIYAAETKYQPQIQELERKADALRERLMVECEDVLTAPQKKALAEVRKASSERRKASSERRKADSESAEEAKDEEKPAAKKKAESTAKKPASFE